MIGKIVGVVKRRVGVEVDAHTFAVAAVVDEDGEVLGRAVREIVQRHRMAGETQIIVERLDIDDRGEELPIVGQEVEVPPQVLVPVALMTQDLAHLLADLAEERLDGHLGLDRQPQRHGVRDHARDTALALVRARRDRHADDEILDARHAVEVGGGGRDQNLRQACADSLRDGAQCGDALGGKVGRPAEQAADIGGLPAR